jgi:hypothetical protein
MIYVYHNSDLCFSKCGNSLPTKTRLKRDLFPQSRVWTHSQNMLKLIFKGVQLFQKIEYFVHNQIDS